METNVITLELPYPPSLNHYWRHVGPRVLISHEGRRFRERVLALLAPLRLEPLSGPLAVQVDLFPPDRRRRDLDNVQKALLDALQHGGAYLDDGDIVRLVLEKHEPVPGGKAIVSIRNL